MLERADANADSVYLDIGGLCVQVRKGGDLRVPLEDIDGTKLGCDQRPISRSEEDRDRVGRQAAILDLYLPIQFTKDLGEPLEVLPGGLGYDIHVFGSTYVPPCADSQPTDQDKPYFRPTQTLKQDIGPKPLFRQLFRALPAKVERNSLSAIVSARLTESGRLASALKRLRRTVSLSRHGSVFGFPSGEVTPSG